MANRACAYHSEPIRNFVLLVGSHVQVDDGCRQKGRQSDKDHVYTEERSCQRTHELHKMPSVFLSSSVFRF